MSHFFLNFLQNIFLCCPFILLMALLPTFRRIYFDKYNGLLTDDCKNRVSVVLSKIHKNLYQLKKFDSTDQETCIMVVADGILIDEEKIKSLSDNAWQASSSSCSSKKPLQIVFKSAKIKI